MSEAIGRHESIVVDVVPGSGGVLIRAQGEGDSSFSVFSRPTDGLVCALELQRRLQAEPWPPGAPISVRMAVHTGEAELRGGSYYGVAVNRCARIRAIGHGGQILVSGSTYELTRDALPDPASLRRLGTHRLKDLAAPEEIFQLCHPSLPDQFPPPASLEAFPNNLPLQLTTFVDREKEIVELRRLIGSSRLVTLTGPGGSGKTRLALQVSADLLEDYPEGVWVVELAGLSDPLHLAPSVAVALGIREEPGRSLEDRLLEAVPGKNLLLILDNCEHLLEGCAAFAERLLRAGPMVRVLATSREPLRIGGETVFQVPPLATPDPEAAPSLETVAANDAAWLFADRARLSQPGFEISGSNALSIAEIVHRLDGIPLAIELAAPKVRVLSPEAISARLDDRFRLLTGGARTALPRHQTLRTLVDWSYDLLSDEEKVLFRRLSVFKRGFTLEAAEAVGGGDPPSAQPVAVLLFELVDKSLILTEEREDETRFRMLETVRLYAREKLDEAGETTGLKDRHLKWFLSFAERAEPELAGPAQSRWLDLLELDYANLRAALDWAFAGGSIEAALRLAVALWRFQATRGYPTEARVSLERALAAESRPSPTRAKALEGAAALTLGLGEIEAARVYAEEALTLARSIGDDRSIAAGLLVTADTAGQLGNRERARDLYREAMTLFGALHDDRNVGQTHLNLGFIERDSGDLDTARTHFQNSVDLARACGDGDLLGKAIGGLASSTQELGDLASAKSLWEESLAIYRSLGDRMQEGWVLLGMAQLARGEGDLTGARTKFEQAREVALEFGAKPYIWYATKGLAEVAGDLGDAGEALRLWRVTVEIADEIGAPSMLATSLVAQAGAEMAAGDPAAANALYRRVLAIYPRDPKGAGQALHALAVEEGARGETERAIVLAAAAASTSVEVPAEKIERLRSAVGDAAFDKLWSEGLRMSLDEAVRFALGN